jgi:hypothetical protein
VNSAICTLFEGDYHLGLAALVNSLSAHGFKGTVYAGYRGPLPPWASTTDPSGTINVTSDITITFVPLTTTIHLTNYKPDFMLDLWKNHCPDADSLFYFDPDIVIKCRWQFFEEWADFGVAVCRDMNGDMPNTHPLRQMWRRILQPLGITFHRSLDVYVNGGFVGVSRKQYAFVDLWKTTLSHMEICSTDLNKLSQGDRTIPFSFPDQDALNITCMAHSGEISAVGADGMDFQWGGGGYIMSHAAGGVKPWRKRFLLNLLTKFQRPSIADRGFAANIDGPLHPFPPARLLRIKLDLFLARALGRFIGR